MTVDDIRERIKKKDIELYVQELLQFENTFDGFKKAIEPLAERLKIGRVAGHCTLRQISNLYRMKIVMMYSMPGMACIPRKANIRRHFKR